MALKVGSPKCVAFISSAIGEFLHERAELHERINRKRAHPDWEAWIFEHMAPDHQHEEDFYLSHVDLSQIVVVVLGTELREGTKKEVLRGRERRKKLYFFLKDISARERFGAELGFELRHCRAFVDAADLCANVISVFSSISRSAGLSALSPSSIVWPADIPAPWRDLAAQIARLCDKGRYEEAFGLLRKPGQQEDAVEVANLGAFIQRRRGEYEVAISIYEQLFEKTGMERFRLNKALALLISGRREEAKKEFDQVNPITAPALRQILGAQLERPNNPLAAMQYLDHAHGKELAKRFGAEFHFLRGLCLAALGLMPRAAVCFRLAASGRSTQSKIARIHFAEAILRMESRVHLGERAAVALEAMDADPVELTRQLFATDLEFEEYISYEACVRANALSFLERHAEAIEVLSRIPRSALSPLVNYNVALVRLKAYGEEIPFETLLDVAGEPETEDVLLNVIARAASLIYAGELLIDGPEAAKLKIYSEQSTRSKEGAVVLEFAAELRLRTSGFVDILTNLVANTRSSRLSKQAAAMALDAALKKRPEESMSVLKFAECIGLIGLPLVVTAIGGIKEGLLAKTASEAWELTEDLLGILKEVVLMDKAQGYIADPRAYRYLGQEVFEIAKDARTVPALYGALEPLERALSEPELACLQMGMNEAALGRGDYPPFRGSQ
ncbi:MAG TPA: hypothetical protein PKA27_03560 [Fimbriimonadaceae bacterium]|nr:hypothetical protein [Fimbriimonadaceae bacterium]